MKSKIFTVFLLIAASFNFYAFADSPLTSTSFYKAYRYIPIVESAINSEGKLTDDQMQYLIDEKNPIDIKVALINALGYQNENVNIFLSYLKKNKFYLNERDFLNKGSGDELLCYAYIKAMDDYFDVTESIKYAKLALSKNNKSYTYNIITSIIIAQEEMKNDWCKVFVLTDNVRKNTNLKQDMNNNASEIIFEYTELYAEYCGGDISKSVSNKQKDKEHEVVKVFYLKKSPGGTFIIPCKVNGLNLSFIFDTGASDVSISITEALFMLKNGYLDESDILGKQYYSIANGQIEEGTLIKIKKLEFEGLTLYDVNASISHNLEAPLLLGQSALSKLGIIQIDYSKNTLKILK